MASISVSHHSEGLVSLNHSQGRKIGLLLSLRPKLTLLASVQAMVLRFVHKKELVIIIWK
jgi:hypothetical protein